MAERTMVLPFGPGAIRIRARGGYIERVEFLRTPCVPCIPRTELFRSARRQFSSYLKGELEVFSLPFRFPETATPFQLKVWRELERITYGSVLTYGELARRVGSAPRAVGGALRANPLPVLIPCHRVVAKNGLGGFAGKRHLAFKSFLLELEKTSRNKKS